MTGWHQALIAVHDVKAACLRRVLAHRTVLIVDARAAPVFALVTMQTPVFVVVRVGHVFPLLGVGRLSAGVGLFVMRPVVTTGMVGVGSGDADGSRVTVGVGVGVGAGHAATHVGLLFASGYAKGISRVVPFAPGMVHWPEVKL